MARSSSSKYGLDDFDDLGSPSGGGGGGGGHGGGSAASAAKAKGSAPAAKQPMGVRTVGPAAVAAVVVGGAAGTGPARVPAVVTPTDPDMRRLLLRFPPEVSGSLGIVELLTARWVGGWAQRVLPRAFDACSCTSPHGLLTRVRSGGLHARPVPTYPQHRTFLCPCLGPAQAGRLPTESRVAQVMNQHARGGNGAVKKEAVGFNRLKNIITVDFRTAEDAAYLAA